MPASSTMINWFNPLKVMPEVPGNCLTTGELFLLKTDEGTLVAQLYAGRPVQAEVGKPGYGEWELPEEEKSMRFWVNAVERGYSTERIVGAKIFAWAHLPQ